MQVLIIDRDENSANLIRSRLEPVGHRVEIHADKGSDHLESLSKEKWDVVFMDPSPLTNAKPLVQTLRRHMMMYPYMIMLSETLGLHEALTSAMNDCIQKPVDPTLLDGKLENAQRLTSIRRQLGDESEDFRSAGGIIAKSAFNQLFLSCIERADRYGESSFLMYFTLTNYNDILNKEGEVEANIASAKMARHLVRLRRQSDIIGQTRKNEYVLLMQRPAYETEPIDAANRFAEALSRCPDIAGSNPMMQVELAVTLVDLPIASKVIEHNLVLRG
jgi:DNA-binding response OmpR family regulator